MNRRGFTLLEITITLSILGVLFMTTYGVFSSALEAKEIVEARSSGSAVLRATIDRIVQDLEAATFRVPTPRAAEGQVLDREPFQARFVALDGGSAEAPLDEILFTALVRRPVTFGRTAIDLAAVRYGLIADPSRAETHLLYREVTSSLAEESFDPSRVDATRSVVVLEGVAALHLRFWDGETWVEEWDSTAPGAPGPMPPAVEITLAAVDRSGDVRALRTSFELPMAPPTEIGAAGGEDDEDDDEDDDDEEDDR